MRRRFRSREGAHSLLAQALKRIKILAFTAKLLKPVRVLTSTLSRYSPISAFTLLVTSTTIELSSTLVMWANHEFRSLKFSMLFMFSSFSGTITWVLSEYDGAVASVHEEIGRLSISPPQ